MFSSHSGHLTTGVEGERLAKIYAEHLGWKIIGENVRLGHKEIDLIAKDKKTIVFLEVKTRRGDEFGTPEESVTKKKLHRLDAAIALYLRDHPEIKNIRLDVIAITYPLSGHAKPKLKHIKGAAGKNPLVPLS